MLNVQPTVVVGLGDVGRRTAAYFKKRFNETYGPLESVLVLAITMKGKTARGGAAAPNPLPYELWPAENLEIDLTDADGGKETIRSIYDWLPEGSFDENGINRSSRAASRLGFTLAASTDAGSYGFIHFLQENLTRLNIAQARDAMVKRDLQVMTGIAIYIVAALDDPVGSGLFLDVAYLLRWLSRGFATAGVNTTGIFFLPDHKELNKQTGANVYASLKELEYHMGGERFHHKFSQSVTVDLDIPPFTHGCFLIDTINEHQISLGNREEASSLAGEWIFQSSLTACKSSFDGFASHDRSTRVAGRLAAYGGLGFSGFVVPVEELIEWASRKLGGDMLNQYILRPDSYQEAVGAIGDFVANGDLDPPRLIEDVISHSPAEIVNQVTGPLEKVPYGKLEQQILRQYRALKGTLERYNAECVDRKNDHRQKVLTSLSQAVTTLLDAQPKGGVARAEQFLILLSDRLEEYRGTLTGYEEELEQHIESQRKLLEQQGEALRRTLKSLPNSPRDYLLLALGFLSIFLLPLLFLSQLYLNVLAPDDRIVGLMAAALTFGLAVLVIVYVSYMAIIEADRIRNHFLAILRDRIRSEIGSLHVEVAIAFYPDIIQETQSQAAKIAVFADNLTDLYRQFRVGSASIDHLTGTIDFPLQRSLLTEEVINRNYAGVVGEIDAHFTPLMERAGPLSAWPQYSLEDLFRHFTEYGHQLFERLKELSVERMLRYELFPAGASEQLKLRELQQHAQELLQKAAPMWNYNRFAVGAHLASMPQLTSYALLSMEDPNQSQLDEDFQRQAPNLKTVATGDAHRLHISLLRQGMPLFGLRMFNEYHKHYGDVLREQSPAMHIAKDYLLIADPLPSEIESDLSVKTLFAVGRAAGFIKQNDEDGGLFVLALEDGDPVILAQDPVKSTALLGLETRAAAELDKGIDNWVKSRGSAEANIELKASLEEQQWTTWEKEAIQEFMVHLRG